jgi:4-oxalomesaconate tautomerase
MPVIILRAAAFNLRGDEPPERLEANGPLKARLEQLRLLLGPRMNLGDVTKKTVPKIALVSPALTGGAINTRTFIPHRVHEAIGVLGAVSVATACVAPGSVAARVAGRTGVSGIQRLDIEHPTGYFTVELDVRLDGDELRVNRSALVRTARKLMRGEIFVPSTAWSGAS